MREQVPNWESDLKLFPIQDFHPNYRYSGVKTITYVLVFSVIGILVYFQAMESSIYAGFLLTGGAFCV